MPGRNRATPDPSVPSAPRGAPSWAKGVDATSCAVRLATRGGAENIAGADHSSFVLAGPYRERIPALTPKGPGH